MNYNEMIMQNIARVLTFENNIVICHIGYILLALLVINQIPIFPARMVW